MSKYFTMVKFKNIEMKFKNFWATFPKLNIIKVVLTNVQPNIFPCQNNGSKDRDRQGLKRL